MCFASQLGNTCLLMCTFCCFVNASDDVQGDAVLTNLEVLDGRYSDSFARHLVVSDLRLLSDNDLQVLYRGTVNVCFHV